MKELIGTCNCCSKEIYCLEGFFYGVHTKEKEIYCFECYKSLSMEKENPQS